MPVNSLGKAEQFKAGHFFVKAAEFDLALDQFGTWFEEVVFSKTFGHVAQQNIIL